MTKTWWGPGPSAHARVIQPDETTGSRQNKEAEMTIQQREPVRLNGSVQVPTLPLADAPPARGTVMMLFMWAAEWPLAKHTSAGAPSLSTNPIIDYHIIYALAVIAVALLYAGNTWGFGKLWAKLPFVQRNRWLL